ncbi:DUF6882 domain-containing protein [Christiangramia crocea]|nr:DUF6882 domain-containing protein [Gramella crocea]
MIQTLFIIIVLVIGLFFAFNYGKKTKNEVIEYKASQSEKTLEEISEQKSLDKPNRTPEFESLSKKAYEYLNQQQKYAEEEYGIGKYEKWFYDQETGLLTFSDNDEIKLKIKYESVGSISKISETWLWSWANEHLEQIVKSDIKKVKKYGEENNIEALTKRKWHADQYDGWEMTAISAYLMKAKGAYRVPTENTYSFMIFKDIIDLR